MHSRQRLRKNLQNKRANLTRCEQIIASQKITEALSKSFLFQQSHRIAAYIAINNEINPDELIKKIWERHQRCYLPVLHGKQLIFSVYGKNTPLKNNRYGIPEPPLTPSSTIEPCNLNLVLVPLLGFTVVGQRLGMGGGFYDRSFNFLLTAKKPIKPYLIGLAYEWQKLETLDNNDWEVPLDAIITENKMYSKP